MVTVKLPEFKCPIVECKAVLNVVSERLDVSAPTTTIFTANCSQCSRRYTVETTTVVRVREGDGPHHDVPPEGVRL